MAVINLKEVLKELNLAKKHFKHAVDLAKKGIVVGEINFPTKEKGSLRRDSKKLAKAMPEPEGKEGT